MIRPRRTPGRAEVARHYDELDPFYRALWGEHLHHGLWTTGAESPGQAALALVDEVARRAGIPAGPLAAPAAPPAPAAFAASAAPAGRRLEVCDVGSGYGAVARRLAEQGAAVTGLTVSAAQYEHAVDSGVQDSGVQDSGVQGSGAEVVGATGQPRFLLRDWLENGLPDASFDAVIAIESLSHLSDPGRGVAEAYRVLRPGGRFVACVWLAAEQPAAWAVRHLLRPICDEGRLPGLPAPSDYGRWMADAGFADAALDDLSHRVAPTWRVVARRVAGAVLRPSSWRYLLDRRNTERAFALTVLRLLVAYPTGAMRYGILTGRKPD